MDGLFTYLNVSVTVFWRSNVLIMLKLLYYTLLPTLNVQKTASGTFKQVRTLMVRMYVWMVRMDEKQRMDDQDGWSKMDVWMDGWSGWEKNKKTKQQDPNMS